MKGCNCGILNSYEGMQNMARFTNQAQLRYGNAVANSNIAAVSYTHPFTAYSGLLRDEGLVSFR